MIRELKDDGLAYRKLVLGSSGYLEELELIMPERLESSSVTT